MATFFRVHPDVNNRDIHDPEGKIYDQDFNEVQPDELEGSNVLVVCTPAQFKVMRATG